MKIQFEDKSYIEIQKSNDKFIVSIASRDGNKLTALSVELTKEQLTQLLENS